MKPKFRRFARRFRRIAFRGLPALIIFSAASINPADAAVVPTDAAGNYTVVGVEANTIQGLGGAVNVITVPGGTVLLGDVVALDGIQIISQGVGPTYTVNNTGLISVTGGGQAVESLVLPVNVNNTGGVMINTLGDLIVIGSGSTVTNSGLLSGENHAISISGNGTVTNTGTIVGDNDVDGIGDGVLTSGDLTLTNSGSITSGFHGVNAAGTLVTITNNGGSIVGTDPATAIAFGIQATSSAGLSTVVNDAGTISGDTNGIRAGSLNSLININGGVISTIDVGGSNAIQLSGTLGGLNNGAGSTITASGTTGGSGLFIGGNLGNGNFLNSVNVGTIISGSGAGADGIHVGGSLIAGHNLINTGLIDASLGDDGVDIDTLSGTLDNQATIVGADNGVEVDIATVGGTILNSGTIAGLVNHGIDAGDNITISNTNSISGNVDGVNVDDDATITNTGSITGTTGNGITAQDDLTLTNTGGTISGDVNGVSANENAIITNTGAIAGADEDGIVADDELTLTNSGTITGDDNGVEAQDEAIITNSGTISGANGNGVDAANELTLTNSNTIVGDDDGVSADDSAIITNTGVIVGNTDDGIETDDTLALTNSGTVVGADNGVEVDEDATVTNQAGGIISGTAGDGILATLDLTVTNDGTIVGGDDGIDTGANALIDNNTTGVIAGSAGDGIFAGALLGLTNDGVISGAANGVQTGDSATIDNNLTGVISGSGGDGVQAGNLLDLSNAGVIAGSVNGIEAGDSAIIDNLVGATIAGGGGDGVQSGNLLDLSNAGTIAGSVNGVETGNTAIIDNFAGATISGGGGDGVLAGNALDLANDGSIAGSVDGVDALDSAVIVNSSTGSISGSSGDGVLVDNLLSLTNSGTIAGGDDGVDALNSATIVNNATGVISGSDEGIDAVDSLNLTNSGSITGGDDGVEAGDSATVLNQLGGTITGTGDDGLDVDDFLSLTNNGTITGAGDDGVDAGDSASIVNNNLIVGSVSNGIEAEDFLSLTNNGTISGNVDGVDADFAASITNNSSITGTTSDGVEADDSLILTNNATITGSGDDGVEAGDDAIIVNNLGATITGSGGEGVAAGDDLDLTNSGTITGFDDGVEAGESSVVTNNFGAVITGTNGDGVDFDGAIGSVLNNSGTINGADGALDGSSGDDVFNLNNGSVINGDVFGWGGSDTINFNGGLTSAFGFPDTTENIIHGDVFDVEFINKTGSGFAVIGDGGLDYDGNTITDPLVTVEADLVTVTSGGLIINGNVIGTDGVSTSTINVAAGAELDGTGTWTANVNLADTSIFSAGATAISLTSQGGPITPEDAIGSLTILGTVTDAVAFRWDVAPQTPINNGVNSDLVTANTYVINSMDLHISPTNLDETITNGVYTIIATNNPVDITGIEEVGVQFNSNIQDLVGFEGSEIFNNLDDLNTNTVLGSFFATVSTSGDGTDVLLEIQHDFEGLPGLTATQSAIGAVFDVESNNPDPDIQDFLAALDYSSLEEVQAVLQALDPSAQLGMVASIVNSNYRVNRMVQNHLFDLRVCEEPMMIAPSGAKDAKGVVAPQESVAAAPSHRYGVWGSLSYDWQDLEGSDEVSDFDGNVGAFTAGFDWRVNPTLAFGILLDGSTADLDHDSGDTDIDSLRVAVYGTWGACTGWYSDFLLGYGKHDLDTDRDTIFGSVDSSSDADSLQALWTVGYTFASGNLKHGPFGGFEYQRVDADGFEEDGDILVDVPVSVDDYEVDSLRALIGYRVNTTYGKFRPYASIAYAHEFGDDEISADASLGGIFGGTSFTVTGPDLTSAILLSAGTGFSINESLTLDVGYRGEISVGDDGIDSHGGSIGLNWTF
jgi:uncharacterized protein YhjY with autotransporter beta-barrel domain